MTRLKYCFLLVSAAALCTSCAGPPVQPAEKKAPEESGAFRIYVTNEVSGDLTVIDSATYNVIATVALGKRPRGIHASPDRKTLYVALSGSPIAGPDVDESTCLLRIRARMESAYSMLRKTSSCERLPAVPILRTSISVRMGHSCTFPTKMPLW